MALIQCPECKEEISDHAKKCPHCGYPIKKTSRNLAIFIFSGILIASCTVVWLATNLISSGNETQIAEATNPPDTTTNAPETQITVPASTIAEMTEILTNEETKEKELKIEPSPDSGTILQGYQLVTRSDHFGNPLTVESNRSDSNDYYIKLIGDFEGKSLFEYAKMDLLGENYIEPSFDKNYTSKWFPYTLGFFLRAGEETTVYVPDGNYTIHYAVGQNWYGKNDLFGESTQFYKLDQIIACDGFGDSQYTLTFHTEDGDIASEKISAEDF
ncbi:zinc ribbon domain-containing protein [Cuneatibacter sp. NSJ-177]|uniref:zinc ribbon domain-containing protein n=1 Tax=Cuneatibacter sp. NSJ-177 TaxID=2931401 RepID=UPI001FD3C4D8|nr:zinc ribbon domain-containing protein [Cuneatibacter sp. NSJ-177]MCJ7837482.1 zinc ribbon domain-containing protein [Cuneatibacter sp. NSJ-177]